MEKDFPMEIYTYAHVHNHNAEQKRTWFTLVQV